MSAVAGELAGRGTGVGEAGHEGAGGTELEYVVGDFGDHDVCGCLALWWSVIMCKVLRDWKGLDAMAGSLVNALGCRD